MIQIYCEDKKTRKNLWQNITPTKKKQKISEERAMIKLLKRLLLVVISGYCARSDVFEDQGIFSGFTKIVIPMSIICNAIITPIL
jgi:hypothetical protein